MTPVPNLSRKLTLEERVMTPDGAGGFDVSWVALGVVWADMRATRGTERVAARRTAPSLSWRILVRAAPDGAPSRPKPEQRFTEGNRVFTIMAVSEMPGTDQYLECWAEEGTLL